MQTVTELANRGVSTFAGVEAVCAGQLEPQYRGGQVALENRLEKDWGEYCIKLGQDSVLRVRRKLAGSQLGQNLAWLAWTLLYARARHEGAIE